MVLDLPGKLFGQEDVREIVGEADTDLNTAHRTSAGTDHANVVTNTSGVATNVTAIALNTTHKGSDGSDHSKVSANETATALNTTHRSSAGTDHANVGSNNTHRTGNGSDHADVATNTAKAGNATHTGEVTGSAALTVADNVLDEANLKLNAATNGYVLTAQSGESGGLKWEAPVASGVTVPIGAVIAWLKSFTNTPALPGNFVECNGQVLSDGDSVYNGQTIPDLNGDNRFLRGNSTSGGTGGSSTHNHQWGATEVSGGIEITMGGGSSGSQMGASYNSSGSAIDITSSGSALVAPLYTSNNSTLPTHYDMVWVMRIK